MAVLAAMTGAVLAVARGIQSRTPAAPRTMHLPAQENILHDLINVSRDGNDIHRWMRDLGFVEIHSDPPAASTRHADGDKVAGTMKWTATMSGNYLSFWKLFVEPGHRDASGLRRYRIRTGPNRRTLGLDEPPGLIELLSPGNALYKQGKVRQALRAYNEVRRTVPGLPALVVAMAKCHLRLKEFRIAERRYQQAISMAGPLPDLYDSLGRTYQGMKLPRPAAEAFERAAGFDADNAARWIKAARALERAGLNAAARAAIRRALVREPGNRRARAIADRLPAANTR